MKFPKKPGNTSSIQKIQPQLVTTSAAVGNAICDAHQCSRARSMAVGILCLALGGLVGCATLPDIASPQVTGKAAPQIAGRRGPLTPEQSKAILERLGTDPSDDGLLKRHAAYEQAISESPLLAGNRTRLL